MRSRRPPGRIAIEVAASVAACLTWAAPAAAETLRDALALTYRANPTLAAERARQRADDENVPRAVSGFFPNVSATASYGPAFERTRPGGGSNVASPLTVGATVDQTLYDGGRTAASVRSAESAVFAGRATLRGVEQDVLLAAVTAYVDVLRDGALIDLGRSNIEFLRETLRISRKRFETGDVSATDPAQTESRLARGEADLATAEANLNTSRATYRQIIGTAPGRLVFPEGSDSVVPASIRAAMSFAFDHHPAIRAAIHVVDVAASDLRVAQGALLPTLSIQGSLSRTFGSSLDATGSASPAVTSQVTVPIYDGGATPALIRQAKETLSQRRVELEIARDRVKADLRTAWGALEAARAAIPARETAVSANEVALAGVRREAMEGQRTTLDVLNAQQELIVARTNLLGARRDRVVTAYAVLAAAGGLGASRLKLAGERYRPETHYRQVRDKRIGTQTPDGR